MSPSRLSVQLLQPSLCWNALLAVHRLWTQRQLRPQAAQDGSLLFPAAAPSVLEPCTGQMGLDKGLPQEKGPGAHPTSQPRSWIIGLLRLAIVLS